MTDHGTAGAAAPPRAQGAIRVSVAVVEAHAGTREHLFHLLGNGGTPFATMAELAARLTGAVPVVVVMGPSCANPNDLSTAQRLIASNPSLGAILVVEELSTSALQAALRVGIRDVIALSYEPTELTEAVRRVALSIDHHPRPAAHAAPAPPTPGQAGAPSGRGKVITVFSTKGGSGKSVVATSLAVTLAQRSGSVCLVDADLQFGDVAVMMKLTPQHTVVDAVASLDRMDAGLLNRLLITHEPSGLKVLPAPMEPAFADQIGSAEMVAIVEMLRDLYEFVVIDTPAYFNDVVLGLVEVSDNILLVAAMDIPNIKNVKIGLQTLRLLGTPMEKVMLILNRSNSKVKLDIGEVERTLQLNADCQVPSDIVVPQSVNKGVPVVLHAPKSGVARAIQQLAEIFLPVAEPRRR